MPTPTRSTADSRVADFDACCSQLADGTVECEALANACARSSSPPSVTAGATDSLASWQVLDGDGKFALK